MGTAAKSEQKVQRILAAVRSILVQNGYANTTIALVAAEAGVSRGLLHYYFKNKEDMLAKALKVNMEFSAELIRDIFEQADSGRVVSERLTQVTRNVMRQEPDILHLFFEGVAVARHSRVVKEEIESLYVQFRNSFFEGLKGAVGKGIIRPALPLGGLAALLAGLIDGMGLQFVTEPEIIDDDEVWDTLKTGIELLLTAKV